MNGPTRRIHDSARAALTELTALWPRLGLRLCDLASAIVPVRGDAARRAAFTIMFPGAPARAWREARRQRARSRIGLELTRRKGFVPFRALPSPAFATLRGPAILGTFHTGALVSLAVAIDQLQTPVFVMKDRPSDTRLPGLTTRLVPANHRAARVLAIHDAVESLRRGELVLLAVDGGSKGSLDIEFRGRSLRINRGAVALARITGAPLIPVVARWRGTRVEIVTGPPLRCEADGSSDAERAMATSIVRWLETYLVESPGEVGPALEKFIEASRSRSAS